jgi:hypothetical protein
MRRQHAAAAAIFIALSVAYTWPLARELGRAVSDPGDPFINIWILDWDFWATVHQPLRLFHANAFYPAKYTLAFSENLYGLAVLLFPLRILGLPPIAAYNMAMLAGFAFCGFAAYLLGRHLTGRFAAGIAAGVFYAFVPYRFVQMPHIQHVWGGWLPLLLLALLLYAQRPDRRHAAFFAIAFAMNGLTNIHYLLFGALAIAVTALLLIPRDRWRDLAIATGGAMLVLAPFLYPYAVVAKLYGMRSYAETYGYSAWASDWLINPIEPERRLFPGFVALVCVAVALLVRERSRLALGLLWIAIGFFGSLGLHCEFHRFLHGAVPGFRAVRVPARWAVIAYVGIAILIAVLTAALARRNRWLAWAVPLALALELYPGHIRYWMTVAEVPPVYRWLAAEGRSPIIELPLDTATSEYVYLLRATAHHRPMVNGISGLAPGDRIALADKWRAFSDDFVGELGKLGVGLMVVHSDALGPSNADTREWLRRELARRRISFVRRFERDWVFALRGGGPPAPLEAWDTFGTQASTGGIDYPQGSTMRGEGYVSGWAKSPYGVRAVEVVFENGSIRYPAGRIGERFIVSIPARPAAIHRDTDFQVEILDGRGVRTRLDPRWVRWE